MGTVIPQSLGWNYLTKRFILPSEPDFAYTGNTFEKYKSVVFRILKQRRDFFVRT